MQSFFAAVQRLMQRDAAVAFARFCGLFFARFYRYYYRLIATIRRYARRPAESTKRSGSPAGIGGTAFSLPNRSYEGGNKK